MAYSRGVLVWCLAIADRHGGWLGCRQLQDKHHTKPNMDPVSFRSANTDTRVRQGRRYLRIRTLGLTAALAMTAFVFPVSAFAETGSAAFRSEPRLSPLGAGGAIDPITIGMRRDEVRIGETVNQQRTSLIDRLVRGPAASNAPIVLGAAPVDPPAKVSDRKWPLILDDIARKGDASAFAPHGALVLAALDTAATPSAKADPFGLPWVATPKVPALLSRHKNEQRPSARDARPAVVTLPALPPALNMHVDLGVELQRLFLPFSSGHVRASRHVERGVSHRREPLWRVRLPVSEMPTRDPLGAIEPPKPVLAAPAFIMPFENGRVTSLFNQGRRHPAIDLAGRHGSPVFATSNGQTVTFAGSRGGYGNAVITRDREGREHLYGHLSAIHVRPGKVLAQGERLGLLGSTGYSTGPHVHYEVKDRRGAHINPVTLLFPRGVRNGYAWAGTGLPRAQAVVTAEARRP